MGASGWATVGIGITAVVSLLVALLTRQSAKETTGVTGLTALNSGLERRVERLETREHERNERDYKHTQWDREIYDQAVAAGWDVAPPPPLG